jgi:hypothetical protein
MDTFSVEGGRGDHELAHQLRMPDGDLLGGVAAKAVAEDIDLLNAEVFQQRGGVVGQLFVGQRAVDIGGTSVTLEFDGDDLSRFRQCRTQ